MKSDQSRMVLIIVVGSMAFLACCLVALTGILGATFFTRGLLVDRAPFEASSSDQLSALPTHGPGLPSTSGVVFQLAQDMAARLDREGIPQADPVELARRFRGVEADFPLSVEGPLHLDIGDQDTFWVTDNDSHTHFQVDAELVHLGEHSTFWVEQGVEVDPDSISTLMTTFDQEIYPTTREFFGSEWIPGVDGDPRLFVLYARGLGDTVAGYYASSDEYPPTIEPYSNQHEMFYLNADTLSLGEGYAAGVLAHEFAHMIQWNQDRNEATWMNEGFAELAALINGYDVGNVDVVYTHSPDLTLTYWPLEADTTPHYGQAFTVMAYFLHRFGADASRMLVAHPANGIASFKEVFNQLGDDRGQAIRVEDFFRDWAIAMYLQDPDFEGGRYTFGSYANPPRASITERLEGCSSESHDRMVSQYGIDYIAIGCHEPFTLSFEGVPYVQVLPVKPHTGDYAYWSNRGDESNMTLSREFDLRQVEGEVLMEYWTWYQIEPDYDYLYLLASTDGGKTWEILTTPSGTDQDPTGNSYGWAYNGYSGGSHPAEWIREEVDLSSYAGEQVILQFEYVTDDALNGEGFLLDDISISAIDYQEGFEKGEGGWKGQGFIRLYHQLPQAYQVVLVESRGGEVVIQDIPLTPFNRGEIQVDLEDSGDRATLIVMATSEYSWQPAPYRIRFR